MKMHRIKEIMFCLTYIKMIIISKMARKNSSIGAIELMISIIADLKSEIGNNRYVWSNEKHIETGVGH